MGQVADAYFSQREKQDEKIYNSSLYKIKSKLMQSHTDKKEAFLNNISFNDGSELKDTINIPTNNPAIEQKTDGRKLSGETEKTRMSFKKDKGEVEVREIE